MAYVLPEREPEPVESTPEEAAERRERAAVDSVIAIRGAVGKASNVETAPDSPGAQLLDYLSERVEGDVDQAMTDGKMSVILQPGILVDVHPGANNDERVLDALMAALDTKIMGASGRYYEVSTGNLGATVQRALDGQLERVRGNEATLGEHQSFLVMRADNAIDMPTPDTLVLETNSPYIQVLLAGPAISNPNSEGYGQVWPKLRVNLPARPMA